MKTPTILLVLALTLGAVVNAAETNTPETTPTMSPGMAKDLNDIINQANGASAPAAASGSTSAVGSGQMEITFSVDPVTGVITGDSVIGSNISAEAAQGIANDLKAIVNGASGASVPAATSKTSYSWPADAPATLGKVQVMIVQGVVNLVAPDGTTTPLKRGQIFEEGAKIVAAKGGNALLVFSNGAVVKVKEGTELTLVKFRQAPFDSTTEGTFLRLTKDPSRSNTLIEVSSGELQGEVKKLNTEAGSSFVVVSPNGTVMPFSNRTIKSSSDDGAEWKHTLVAGE